MIHISAMWFENQALLERLASRAPLRAWEEEAAERHESLSLSAEYTDISRVGTLRIRALPGQTDLNCWMYPLDLSKVHGVLLGAAHEVAILDEQGEVQFRGSWAEVPENLFATSVRHFIWLAPPQRGQNAKVWKVKKRSFLSWFGLGKKEVD